MKRILLAAAGLAAIIGLSGQAAAADLGRQGPYKAPVAAPYMAPLYNWSGFYVGVNGGGGSGRSTWDGGLGTFNRSGWLAGGTAGVNWQTGQFVLGLETDIDWTNISGTATCARPLTCTTKNNWLGTTRARLGYAWDRFMPYITGGVAYGDINAFSALGNETATRVGWTAGAGLEFAFAGNWTAKVEYLFVDLGSFTCATCAVLPTNVSSTAGIVRGGVNLRF